MVIKVYRYEHIIVRKEARQMSRLTLSVLLLNCRDNPIVKV